jgi:hypothetical protein
MVSAVDENGMNSIYQDMYGSYDSIASGVGKAVQGAQSMMSQAAPAAGPVDTVGQAPQAGMIAPGVDDRAAKDALIDQMLNQQAAGNSPENIAKLKEELSAMPVQVLQECAQHGVNISIVPRGASIALSCYVIVNTSYLNFSFCFLSVWFFVKHIVKSRRVTRGRLACPARVTKTRRVGCHCEEA